jgi:polysaccharide biosynthesis/export protein
MSAACCLWRALVAPIKLLAVFFVAVVVAGCASAPGFYWTADKEDAPADAPKLFSISPELIRLQRAIGAQDPGQEIKHLFVDRGGYRYKIGAGDVLSIVVWGHPDLVQVQVAPTAPPNLAGGDPTSSVQTPAGYNVSGDGTIQFPFVGPIKLDGKTEDEARLLLIRELSKYVKSPQITVRVIAYRSGRVFMEGEVRTPGVVSLNDVPLTLPEALARVGGLTPAADRAAIYLQRGAKTTLINMHALALQGLNANQIMLSPGDLVRVSSRDESKVFVIGEVLKSSSQLLRNGRLNLNEALVEAGGINPNSADARQIYVIRAKADDKPEIFHLNASTPQAYALAEGFELKSRDVVFVDPAPLVRWNRIISLILPSAQAVSATGAAIK